MKRAVLILLPLILTVITASCVKKEHKMNDKASKVYAVTELQSKIEVDSDWKKPQWQTREALVLKNYMGDKPEHFPHVEAKLAYNEENIYAIFRVEDNYIRAVAEDYHDPVCKDSCVEFFFTPGEDISAGYMNMETNCCGKILFNYQKKKGTGIVRVSREDLDKIEIAHSLPYDRIEEEITQPTVWTVEYRIPVSVIEKYMPAASPESGVVWKGNFYKCADKTSKPHWLTWAKVDKPEPDFHRPEFFGTLKFE